MLQRAETSAAKITMRRSLVVDFTKKTRTKNPRCASLYRRERRLRNGAIRPILRHLFNSNLKKLGIKASPEALNAAQRRPVRYDVLDSRGQSFGTSRSKDNLMDRFWENGKI
jgi:hypothetical protein